MIGFHLSWLRKVLNMSSSTAVAILCGDVSRRLGVSKALMLANGKPLFKVVEENLSPLGLAVYLVSKVPFESGGDFAVSKLPVYSCGHASTTKRSVAAAFGTCL